MHSLYTRAIRGGALSTNTSNSPPSSGKDAKQTKKTAKYAPKRLSAARQAGVLTATSVVTRCMGFLIRILLTRIIGAEAIGIVEIASSAHMIASAPVASGIPIAVSRMTAVSVSIGDNDTPHRYLAAGLRLSLILSIPIVLFMGIFSPLIANMIGDIRTLPAIWLFLPCIIFIGLASAYDGYFYGLGRPLPPSISEITEQLTRFFIILAAISIASRLALPWAAAIPAAAASAGVFVGYLYIFSAYRREKPPGRIRRTPLRQMWNASSPMMGMRISATLLRGINAIIVPARLQASGLTAQLSLAGFGIFSGMAMPLIMLPMIAVGALSVVTTPAIARNQSSATALGGTLKRALGATAIVSALSMLVLYLFGGFLSNYIYKQPDLMPLLYALAPYTVILSFQNVLGSVLNGMGKQRAALMHMLWSGGASLVLTYVLTALPQWRLMGCVAAHYTGGIIAIALHGAYIYKQLNKKRAAPIQA